MSNTDHSNHQHFAFSSLENIRKRLLDLTNRSPLLNYKFPKVRSLNLFDLSPNAIVELLSKGGKLGFRYVPLPSEKELIEHGYIEASAEKKIVSLDKKTNLEDEEDQEEKINIPPAEEWAKKIGLNIQHDLPLTSQQLHTFQTTLYPTQLDNKLKSLRLQAESAIEETGANILYLVLGFLEWQEEGNSAQKKRHLAPLFTLPIQITAERIDVKTGTRLYSISLKDDDSFSNVTLKEKLANDFGLTLPLVEEDTQPEDYFKAVEDMLGNIKPDWKIKRYGCLALLNFSKQAMYEDLNPENWPAWAPLEQHHIVQQLFATHTTKPAEGSLTRLSEYPLDEMGRDIHHQFPLIYDADSSQHSALIDAVSGKNLVIEGPPGTGKSQTITNLIAACLNSGKTVLFVAEKMAALNVVKDRLDRASLGDFCLELHSHRTNKQKMLTDLVQKMDKQDKYRDIKHIDDEIDRYENYKEKLKYYAELLNQEWQQTGKTIHQILTGAVRYRHELELSPDQISLDDSKINQITKLLSTELIESGKMLVDIYKQVAEQSPDGNIESHYWHGIQKESFLDYEEKALIDALKQWNSALEALYAFYQEWQATFGFELEFSLLGEDLSSFSTALSELPVLQGGEKFSADLAQGENIQALSQFVQDCKTVQDHFAQAARIIKQDKINAPQTIVQIFQKIDPLVALYPDLNVSLSQSAFHLETARQIQAKLNLLESELEKIRPNLPTDLQPILHCNLSSFEELTTLVKFINHLQPTLWNKREALFDDVDLAPLLSELERRFSLLHPLHQKLMPVFQLEQVPDLATLRQLRTYLQNGGLFRIFSSQWRGAKRDLLALAKEEQADFDKLQSLLPDLILYQELLLKIKDLNHSKPRLKKYYQGIKTPISDLRNLWNWYQEVRTEYGRGFGDRVKIGSALFSLNQDLAFALSKSYEQTLATLIKDIQTGIKLLNTPIKPLYRIGPETNLSEGSNPLEQLIKTLVQAQTGLSDYFAEGKLTLSQIMQATQGLKEAQALKTKITNKKNTLTFLPASWTTDFDSQAITEADQTLLVMQSLNRHPQVLEAFLSTPTQTGYLSLQKLAEKLPLVQAHLSSKENAFMQAGQVDRQLWIDSQDSLEALLQKNQIAIAKPRWLHTWTQYQQAKQEIMQQGLGKIIACLERKTLDPDQLHTAINLAIYHQLAQEIFTNNPDIRKFNATSHNSIIQRFRECDKHLMALQQEKIAYNASRRPVAAGTMSGLVRNYTEAALIRHEQAKKTRHISIRNLLDRSSNAIQALMPCFMMSPMSVAQYLKPGNFQFDVVVMDEASQILPEDAIGALARGMHQGSSVVIVGDPKQLPPTSFFSASLNQDEIDNDAIAVEKSESILDSAMNHQLFKTRRLRWHYRSRHESLIAFSNQQFYDSDLVLFPSPMERAGDLGIRWHRMQGLFENKINRQEAQAMVQMMAKILRQSPEESIGLVAMNSTQRDAISEELDRFLQDNPDVQDLYEKKAKVEPIFVKNLENVQGDERDVILISMTYGRKKAGERVMQNFGPINANGGWRRLNVLFTRAKKRMHIFSSMGSSDIVLTPTSSQGLRALHDFLAYCENQQTYTLDRPENETDSDFALAVKTALAQAGYNSQPQVGVNGFFLDLAVRNPNYPSQFLIGIECDGPTYHSANTVRDRDRLRQEVLENLGWEIHRIWSTDWYKNPEAALTPVLHRLKALQEKSALEAENPLDWSLDFDFTPPAKLDLIEADGEESEVCPDKPLLAPCAEDLDWFEQPLSLEEAIIIGVIEPAQLEDIELEEVGFDKEKEPEPTLISQSPESLVTKPIEEESPALTLKERLQALAQEIEQANPNPTGNRLLRPGMIEMFLIHQPFTREDFLREIPDYFRNGTAVEEARDYLDRVLAIIAEG
ncbi:hypothetical protein A4G20_01240 [Pasteurellaceae bacterium RH1A]|nr:hypothetical protein A4G20_01240 [Pasteurellaceae bacterium RH1A]